MAKIVEVLDAGTLKVLMDLTVPLKDFGAALEHQASGLARGTIVVSFN